MTDAFLHTLVQNIRTLIQQEVGLIMGVGNEMRRISDILITIQPVLPDAEDKQLERIAIRNWLCKLNDLAYELDDLLDECATHTSKLKSKNLNQKLKKVLFRLKIGRRLKEMTNKLDAVAAEGEIFHLRMMPMSWQMEGIPARRRETGSSLNEDHCIYGRDNEKEEIVDILVNSVKNCQQVLVLPIVGIGGVGKTTLARFVCEDERVVKHFEVKFWVCASNTFELKTLLKVMIESITKTATDLVHIDALQKCLRKLLNHKRYLLVLDDVWNEDQEKWAELRNTLACGLTGSSIIVTTRLKKVADIMRTLPIHYLTELLEEHCWLLFNQQAFGHENDEYPHLEAIGREIVKKSVGVPLAAKTLGGLLRFKRKEKEWAHVNECELWNLPQQESSILPALRLSYLHLPITLRQCFAYCALFPKDSRILKKDLIFLWMAHGCLQSNGKQDEEEIGDQVLNELILRSLLEVVTEYEGMTELRMHDLVHDLAQSVMENKGRGAQEEINKLSASNFRVRHLVIEDSIEDSVPFPTSIQRKVSATTNMCSFSSLRMLNASRSSIERLPPGIGKLIHLRHLNLADSSVRTLPDAICDLLNLKILNLTNCWDLEHLPKNMRYLKNLHHLLLENCASLSKMPSKIRELTSLKTLSLFIVGDSKDNQLGELECLNLGGRLEILHLERAQYSMDAEKANLGQKPDLRDLVLRWESGNASKEQKMMAEKVLEALEPHPNIEALEICGYTGMYLPLWMRNLTNVTSIALSDCPNVLFLPLEFLPLLKHLSLTNLNGLEYVMEGGAGDGNSGKRKFSSLQELTLVSLHNLKGLLKEEVGEVFSNLEDLFISNCQSLILPPLSSLKQLSVYGCSKMTLSSFSKLDNLTSLVVELDKNMGTCIPNETFENLSHLTRLEIVNVQGHCLPVEGLRGLKSLRVLSVSGSATMMNLPEGWLGQLTALEELNIRNFPELMELPEDTKCLHILKVLRLSRLTKMVSLPEALQHVLSLKELELDQLPQLSSLPDWLSNFTSLELKIMECPGISSLPSTIQGMTNLRSLGIYYCPELERRYEKGKGEDWNKIAHIPEVYIQGRQ